MAVLLGLSTAGAMISASLFLALRAHLPAAAPSSSATLAAGAPSSPTVAPMDRSVVQRAVASGIERQRPAIDEACWEPAKNRDGMPPRLRYSLNFTISANGTQMTRGIDEAVPSRAVPIRVTATATAASHSDVTTCLAKTLAPVRIDPPGATVYVEVPFEVP
jgi:hypothetical protein